MYRTKNDVDKYVESLIVKLCTREIKSRALSIARLYFDVEDYANCQEYVEKHLAGESNDAAAYKLLGQALQELGRKELALERYITSLDLDPTQTSIILNICELLTDERVPLEPERAQHWCDKADEAFPKHQITFHLRKRLITTYNLDSAALVKLLKAQIAAKSEDASLHIRLLEHYISCNEIKQAFEYGYMVEFNTKEVFPFENSSPQDNYAWYKLLNTILKLYSRIDNVKKNWHYQLLFLTVRERLCYLGLRESASVTNLATTKEIIYDYDEALQIVAKAGGPVGFDEFHANLLQHHRGQFAFHAATHLVKINRSFHDDNRRESGVLMLLAFQSGPSISKDNPIQEVRGPRDLPGVVNRWYLEAVYRCSQSGHYLIREYNNRQLDIPHNSSNDKNWKEQVYDKMYNTKYSAYRENDVKLRSYWLSSNAYKIPLNRKPHEADVTVYDGEAQKYFEKQRDSLQYFVWTLLQYEDYAQYKTSPTISVCGSETLNMLDINAFLYCTALRSGMSKLKVSHHPAHIVDQLYSNFQRVWWNCTQKDGASFSDNDNVIFKRGIEIIRCVGYHGLDVELLCKLGRIFSEKAKTMTSEEEKKSLEQRASLYYQSAIPLLEQIRSTPMFETKQKNFLTSEQSDKLIEESRLYVGIHHRNVNEYDKSIEILSHLESGEGFYHIAQTYKKNALETNSNTEVSKSKIVALLTNAKKYTYKAKEHLKKSHQLYIDNKELSEAIEIQLNNIDPDLKILFSDVEKNYSNTFFSTPNAPSNSNKNHRTATDSQILESLLTDLNIQNRTEKVKKIPLSGTEIKQQQNTNKIESERIREIIKKIANITNEVNELKDLTMYSAKSIADGFLSGTCLHNHQIVIPPSVPSAPAISAMSTIPTVPVVPILPTLTSMSAVSLPTSETTSFTDCNKVSLSPQNKSQGDESDGGDYMKEEECHAHFNPVIPMPDKVDVVTGEENEVELYSHRARLYRFVSSEWKERGTGILKVLKHNETKKIRVVMRREQVLKVCLNHALTPEITYKPKDEKSWLFSAYDVNHGWLTLCLRFQNKDIALQFKEAVDNALAGKPVCASKLETKTETDQNDNDVVFVSETQASEEEKKKAKELMLPENFYTYKNKNPCKGCRGCEKDDGVKPESSSTEAIKAILSAPPVTSSPAMASTVINTPVKSTFSAFQSPTTSNYGTPGTLEKTLDTSIFRTPLGSTGSNTKSSTPNTNNNDAAGADATNKENIFTQKPFTYSGTFGNFGEKSLMATPTNSSGTVFGAGDFQPATGSKSSLTDVPKLNTITTTSENKIPDAKSIFASAATASKPSFGVIGIPAETYIFGNTGVSTNKSLMAFASNKSKDDSNAEIKSLFGNNDQKSLNICSGSAQGSLFGPGSLGNQSKPAGSFSFSQTSTPQNEGFKSIFSCNTSDQSSFWNTYFNTGQKKTEVSISAVFDDDKDQDKTLEKEKEPETKEPVLKIDSSLTFADLTSSGPGFTVQKTPDFKWEGSGQPLYSAGQKAASKVDKNASGASEEAADEEYDPHYEPIVPLPEKIVLTTDEEDEVDADSCARSGLDLTADKPVEKSVTVNIYDSYTAMQFYDSCGLSRNTSCLQSGAEVKGGLSTIAPKSIFASAAKAANDIALQYKKPVDMSLAGKPDSAAKLETTDAETDADQNDNDVVFVSETQASEEEKKKAKKLMLPENFYTYKNKKSYEICELDDEENPNGEK